jgi:hypothetical protein
MGYPGAQQKSSAITAYSAQRRRATQLLWCIVCLAALRLAAVKTSFIAIAQRCWRFGVRGVLGFAKLEACGASVPCRAAGLGLREPRAAHSIIVEVYKFTRCRNIRPVRSALAWGVRYVVGDMWLYRASSRASSARALARSTTRHRLVSRADRKCCRAASMLLASSARWPKWK